jgi:plastocyanin
MFDILYSRHHGDALLARLLPSLVLVVIPFVAACSSPAAARPVSTTPPTASTRPSPVAAAPNVTGGSAPTVTMTNALRFEPATLTVPRGTTVTWLNATSMDHTVTDDPAKAANKADVALPTGGQAWDSGTIAPGQRFQHTFDTPGTYRYVCIPHEAAGMVGTITVTG